MTAQPAVIQKFYDESAQEVENQGKDTTLIEATRDWFRIANGHNYSYHFNWLGRPIIQYPQDMVAFQEIVWQTKPDLIIEMGIAHGGSLILSASMLSLLDYSDAVENGTTLDPKASKRKVLGVDVDIRPHNREAIEEHPMSHRIEMIEGSSISDDIISRVHDFSRDYSNIMVCLDSNHTHDHVLAELEAYASLTSVGNYCIVFDTVIEDLPENSFPDRPWDKGNNPKTAVQEFLKTTDSFVIDHHIDSKLLISVAPSGYLKRVS